MPRTKTRARQRRALAAAEQARITTKIETLRERIKQAKTSEDRIEATDELVRLMKWIAASGHLRLWSFFPEYFGPAGDGSSVRSPKPSCSAPSAAERRASAACDDGDDMRALIAQLVAPHLTGRPPRWVRRRE